VWLLAQRVGATPRAALAAAASAAIASPLWPYSKFGFSTPLTALVLLLSAWLLADREPRRQVSSAAAAGVIVAYGWLTRHEMAIVLLPFVAFLLLAHGPSRRETWRRGAAFVGCALAGGRAVGLGQIVAVGPPRFGGLC